VGGEKESILRRVWKSKTDLKYPEELDFILIGKLCNEAILKTILGLKTIL